MVSDAAGTQEVREPLGALPEVVRVERGARQNGTTSWLRMDSLTIREEVVAALVVLVVPGRDLLVEALVGDPVEGLAETMVEVDGG